MLISVHISEKNFTENLKWQRKTPPLCVLYRRFLSDSVVSNLKHMIEHVGDC